MMSHFSFLTWVCFLFFWSFWLKVYQFYWNSQRTSFWFHWFLLAFCILLQWLLLWFFIISILLFTLGFTCSSFSSVLRWNLRSLIWEVSSFQYSTIHFFLSTALAASHKFWYVVFSFSFHSNYSLICLLISSLIQGLLKSLLFRFLTFGEIPRIFWYWFLSIPLWSENILRMNWILWIWHLLYSQLSLSWKMFHVHWKKYVVHICWVDCSINNGIKLIDNGIQVYYIPADLLPTLKITKRSYWKLQK